MTLNSNSELFSIFFEDHCGFMSDCGWFVCVINFRGVDVGRLCWVLDDGNLVIICNLSFVVFSVDVFGLEFGCVLLGFGSKFGCVLVDFVQVVFVFRFDVVVVWLFGWVIGFLWFFGGLYLSVSFVVYLLLRCDWWVPFFICWVIWFLIHI